VATPDAPPEHHHEMHLPPVGRTVRVALDGKSADVDLATLPHEGTLARVTALFLAAWPTEDPKSLHFDLTGSDGFHPGSRPACSKLLGFTELSAARIDIVSHDITFDPTFDTNAKLPGCYRVKAVVTMDGIR
jgi:hypothetical protein